MKLLLSIKPEYIQKIISGEKKYEFRKVVFKNRKVKDVIVYASRPISKIVGEFSIETIIEGDPKSIWNRTKYYSGVNELFFNNYFKGRDKGYAIKLKNYKSYSKPIPLENIGVEHAPQSFLYLNI